MTVSSCSKSSTNREKFIARGVHSTAGEHGDLARGLADNLLTITPESDLWSMWIEESIGSPVALAKRKRADDEEKEPVEEEDDDLEDDDDDIDDEDDEDDFDDEDEAGDGFEDDDLDEDDIYYDEDEDE